MEKEELQGIIDRREDEKMEFESKIDFFRDLLERSELAGRNRIEAEMNVTQWQQSVKVIEDEFMKTLENILYDELVRTRHRFAKLKANRESNPQSNWIRKTVAQRLGMSKDSGLADIVEKLKSMNEDEKAKKLEGIIK
ncbi:hypothetical protein [Microscilla marina]|uniref:Uncharacterized protein n=1 Tax=Microscilla marina ATCC 23134 TaxID=313606 RepID=A1ZJN3_MICM2|nr:hypothetical protein [Microscilla marina]EAY29336.1 hypothetical protein M23134_01392 [Microscilla marina ATCC 23134]